MDPNEMKSNGGHSGTSKVVKDPTFRSYTAAQAAAYAQGRKGYSNSLYEYVLSHHKATGGSVEQLLDVGCGTGNATEGLAKFFDDAVGVDPGEAMIAQANQMGYTTKSGNKVIFELSGAEDIANISSVEAGSVDLITCAMSAHWFHLEHFYPAAARMLKPGGSLAMWTCGSFFVHPDTPNADTVQQHLSKLELDTLKPFTNRGNMMSYHIYDTIELPWTLSPRVCQAEFYESDLHRKAWNRDGEVSEGETGGYLSGDTTTSLADAAKALGTASMVTRWREANSSRIASGEIKDCVAETFENIRVAMGVAPGQEQATPLRRGMATGLVILKRR